MPKLTALVSDRATVRVPFGDESLRVTYRPGVVTPKFQKAVMQAQRDQDIETALCQPLADLIDGWDLTDDVGAAMAITADVFAGLPSQMLLTILTAITEDMAPNATRGAASSNGSSATGGSAASRIGTAS